MERYKNEDIMQAVFKGTSNVLFIDALYSALDQYLTILIAFRDLLAGLIGLLEEVSAAVAGLQLAEVLITGVNPVNKINYVLKSISVLIPQISRFVPSVGKAVLLIFGAILLLFYSFLDWFIVRIDSLDARIQVVTGLMRKIADSGAMMMNDDDFLKFKR